MEYLTLLPVPRCRPVRGGRPAPTTGVITRICSDTVLQLLLTHAAHHRQGDVSLLLRTLHQLGIWNRWKKHRARLQWLTQHCLHRTSVLYPPAKEILLRPLLEGLRSPEPDLAGGEIPPPPPGVSDTNIEIEISELYDISPGGLKFNETAN